MTYLVPGRVENGDLIVGAPRGGLSIETALVPLRKRHRFSILGAREGGTKGEREREREGGR